MRLLTLRRWLLPWLLLRLLLWLLLLRLWRWCNRLRFLWRTRADRAATLRIAASRENAARLAHA